MKVTAAAQIIMYGQKPYAAKAVFNPLLTISTTPNSAPRHATYRTICNY
jgi:hypothetical protein